MISIDNLLNMVCTEATESYHEEMRQLGDFNVEDFCICGSRGRLIYHNDYIEELKCEKCGKTWERKNK